jgi:hypothetical protein
LQVRQKTGVYIVDEDEGSAHGDPERGKKKKKINHPWDLAVGPTTSQVSDRYLGANHACRLFDADLTSRFDPSMDFLWCLSSQFLAAIKAKHITLSTK